MGESGNLSVFKGLFRCVLINRPTENKLKSDINDLRDEFNWYFELATQRSSYPYPKSMLGKIGVIADMIFTESNFYDSHDILAAKLLNRTPSQGAL